jgi:hypothetical protein
MAVPYQEVTDFTGILPFEIVFFASIRSIPLDAPSEVLHQIALKE